MVSPFPLAPLRLRHITVAMFLYNQCAKCKGADRQCDKQRDCFFCIKGHVFLLLRQAGWLWLLSIYTNEGVIKLPDIGIIFLLVLIDFLHHTLISDMMKRWRRGHPQRGEVVAASRSLSCG